MLPKQQSTRWKLQRWWFQGRSSHYITRTKTVSEPADVSGCPWDEPIHLSNTHRPRKQECLRDADECPHCDWRLLQHSGPLQRSTLSVQSTSSARLDSSMRSCSLSARFWIRSANLSRKGASVK